MAKRFDSLSEQHISFIRAQKIFFVGTAAQDSRVNLSPKGMDTLRVLDDRRVAWLNVTGSGSMMVAVLSSVQLFASVTVSVYAFPPSPAKVPVVFVWFSGCSV